MYSDLCRHVIPPSVYIYLCTCVKLLNAAVETLTEASVIIEFRSEHVKCFSAPAGILNDEFWISYVVWVLFKMSKHIIYLLLKDLNERRKGQV